jgi:hypothetical protein
MPKAVTPTRIAKSAPNASTVGERDTP